MRGKAPRRERQSSEGIDGAARDPSLPRPRGGKGKGSGEIKIKMEDATKR